MKMLKNLIDVAAGRIPAELVLKNATALDVFSGTWVNGDIAIHRGTIVGIGETYEGVEERDCSGHYVVPGFIDAHIHIESTMMMPQEFAKSVMPLGTTAAIWDPHEIANVYGMDGLQWALSCAEKSKLDLFVMLSSCVPSSQFETAGATIDAAALSSLKSHPKVLGLAEMMDFPSVVNGNKDVLEKILSFADRPKDGHAPLLMGKDLNAYLTSGANTCHEVCTLEEAKQKLSRGMKVMIREGSVAKNASMMSELMTDYSSPHCFLCTDDRNPLDIEHEGHLDFIIKLAIKRGISPEVAYRSVSHAPALHYGLKNLGAIAPSYQADLVILSDIKKVAIIDVLKKGRSVKDKGWQWPEDPAPPPKNSFHCTMPEISKLKFSTSVNKAQIIGVIPGQIITDCIELDIPLNNSEPVLPRNIQKIAVFERHKGTGNFGLGLVSGFNLREGAIASSVAHDAHNIGVVGCTDELVLFAAEKILAMKGGIIVVDGQKNILASLALPVGGLMSDLPFNDLVAKISSLRAAVKSLGCDLAEPFLQLSFLALPVIPSLKITDLGVIDVNRQRIVKVFR